jgi:hypothetical protein
MVVIISSSTSYMIFYTVPLIIPRLHTAMYIVAYI